MLVSSDVTFSVFWTTALYCKHKCSCGLLPSKGGFSLIEVNPKSSSSSLHEVHFKCAATFHSHASFFSTNCCRNAISGTDYWNDFVFLITGWYWYNLEWASHVSSCSYRCGMCYGPGSESGTERAEGVCVFISCSVTGCVTCCWGNTVIFNFLR